MTGGGGWCRRGRGRCVGQRLLLTNNHVLPDVATAEQAAAEFNWEIDLDDVTGTAATYRLDPKALFLTDAHLDYSLVAVQAGPDGRPLARSSAGTG